MAEGFYKFVTKELSALGFTRIKKGGKGSHEKWRNEKSGMITLVPRNLKSKHTAKGILKDCGSAKKI